MLECGKMELRFVMVFVSILSWIFGDFVACSTWDPPRSDHQLVISQEKGVYAMVGYISNIFQIPCAIPRSIPRQCAIDVQLYSTVYRGTTFPTGDYVCRFMPRAVGILSSSRVILTSMSTPPEMENSSVLISPRYSRMKAIFTWAEAT